MSINATTTAAEHRAAAAQHDRDAADSFERCDTDGFVSQWASGVLARKSRLAAQIAENGGRWDFPALFLADGTLASTRQGRNDYGPFWILNDEAAHALGRRYVSTSQAQSDERRRANNRRKGVTVGTISVPAYADLAGGGSGLANASSVYAVAMPDLDALRSGDFSIVTVEA